jgi:hypothetical protein
MVAPRRKSREYKFEIDAFTPETIPLSRLSQYLSDLARIMGQESSVHFARVEKGSTVPVIRVDWEAEPKVRERLRAVKFNEGPAEARRAYREINKRLVEDNANGVLIDPSANKVLQFRGRDAANQIEFGPISQAGTVQGIPIKIGGENDPVPVHLEDGSEKSIVLASRALAKDLAPHLFTSMVRIHGMMRAIRNRMGEWELLAFHARSFELIPEGDVRSNIAELQAIPAKWKSRKDPLAELMAIRSGGRPQ